MNKIVKIVLICAVASIITAIGLYLPAIWIAQWTNDYHLPPIMLSDKLALSGHLFLVVGISLVIVGVLLFMAVEDY